MAEKKSKRFIELGIEAIAFDLDDTLWPCAPAIAGVEKAYFDWIKTHFPEAAAEYDADQIVAMRRSLLVDSPELKNDVTELRRLATTDLLTPFGADKAQVDELMQICLTTRQNVSLYSDVLDGLQRLSACYSLASMTNGNADLSVIGIRKYFDVELAATLSLAAKPAPDMFLKACELLDVSPQSVLYVGDNVVNDVVAARDVGLRTAWIDRFDVAYPADVERADFEIVDLGGLVGVACS